MKIRPLPTSFRTLGWLLALLPLACLGFEGTDPEEREASAEAVQEVLQALPDSARARMASPLDTLFVGYDHPALRFAAPGPAEVRRTVDSVMAALTPEQKLGQLFILELPRATLRTYFSDAAAEAVRAHHVGGFIVSRLSAPAVVYRQTTRLQAEAAVPLFFAADYERGVGRFDNPYTELPANMAIGATGDTMFAAAAGRLTAIESRSVGVNMVFAPVVDVNNNPRNPIINIRSYGEDPERVGAFARAYVREAQAQGALTTPKHFPGHGNTATDSHARMGVIEGSRADLERTELAPYRMLMQSAEQPAGVMSAHLWIRALDPEPLPATLSPNVLTGLLRDDLGFGGFVVTDDIKMGALRSSFPLEERIVRALRAGADVILMPPSAEAGVRVVREALADGRLPAETVERAVRNVVTAKARAGLFRQATPAPEGYEYLHAEPRGAFLAQTIADRAVTLLKTHPALPLRASRRVALVQLSNAGKSESIGEAMDYFERLLEPDVRRRLDHEPKPREAERVLEAAAGAEVVVVALYQRLTAGRGAAGLRTAQARLVQRLVARKTPVILVTFGNPYAVTTFAEADGIVVAYDQSVETILAAAKVLQGRLAPSGRLPIRVDPYPLGAGL